MKKIEKEVKSFVNVFVSIDGKEFDNEADCKTWEKSYTCTLEASWQTLQKKNVSDTDFGIPWSSDNNECYIIKPKSLDEITLINAYVANAVREPDWSKITTEDIGRLLLLNFGYSREWGDVYRLDEHFKRLNNSFAKVQEEFNTETATEEVK